MRSPHCIPSSIQTSAIHCTPQEVLAFDPHCAIHDEIGHNSSSSMSEYTFPLNEERSGPVILSVEFRPNWSVGLVLGIQNKDSFVCHALLNVSVLYGYR